MSRNKLTKKKLQEGFTIIEVMIVLAIAGLILVVVLVAIPQLQRNQRNNARQSISARITTEVSNFAGNNNGNIPNAATGNTAGNFGNSTGQSNTFTGKYLGGVDINDPSTGDPVGLEVSTSGNPAQGVVRYNEGRQCLDGGDGANTTTGASGRSFTIQIGLEGGLTYCLDNQ